MRRAATIVLAAAAAVVLAGCATQQADSVSDHPLQEYVDRIAAVPTEEEQTRAGARVEEAIAQCMVELGFEYSPAPDAAAFVVAGAMDPESDEFVHAYGYGISTEPWGDTEQVRGEDPNAAYRASLSPAQGEAYDRALYGEPADLASEGAVTEWNWETAGCNGRAFHDEMGDASFDDPEFDAVLDAQNAILADAIRDPSVIDSQLAWADCMGSAGYDVETKDDPRDSITSELDALYQQMPAGLSEEEASSWTPSDMALSDLQAREVATAVADLDCARESGYADALSEAVHRGESAYVAAHRDELDALVARYADR